MRSVIEGMIDRAGLKCSLCQKPAGTCPCWIKCRCGWSRERGEPCGNPSCKRKPKLNEGRARPKEAVEADRQAIRDWEAKVEALAGEVSTLAATHDAPIIKTLGDAWRALNKQDLDAADWHLDQAAMMILAIRAKVRSTPGFGQ